MPGEDTKAQLRGTTVGTGLSVSRIQTERRDLGREGKTRPEGKVVKYRSRGLGWGEACGSGNTGEGWVSNSVRLAYFKMAL